MKKLKIAQSLYQNRRKYSFKVVIKATHNMPGALGDDLRDPSTVGAFAAVSPGTMVENDQSLMDEAFHPSMDEDEIPSGKKRDDDDEDGE